MPVHEILSAQTLHCRLKCPNIFSTFQTSSDKKVPEKGYTYEGVLFFLINLITSDLLSSLKVNYDSIVDSVFSSGVAFVLSKKSPEEIFNT